MSRSTEKYLSAFDTETSHGYARLIATPDRCKLIYSFDEAFYFLIGQSTKRYFTFNLRFDAQALLKYLPNENLIELSDTNETKYNFYKIFFIPKKVFRVYKGYNGFTAYDLAQFFGTGSLDSLAKKYLNEGKDDNIQVRNLKGHAGWEMDSYIERNEDILSKYAMKDAQLTEQLGVLFLDKMQDIYGFRLLQPTSNAGVGAKATLKHVGSLYRYPKTFEHDKWSRYAEAAYRGGIFDVFKRGTFYDVTDLDVSSAYPSKMKDFPHWANGLFHEIEGEDELLPDDYYGWVICQFSCPWIPYPIGTPEEWDMEYRNHKLTVATDVSKIVYPEGERFQCVTLAEYYFMKKYGYPCQLLKGYVWRHEEDKYPSPFSWIPKIYDKKKLYERGSMEYLLTKIGPNGVYGKTAQSIGAANLRNMGYASYTTALTRIQVASFILDKKLENRVINIATDGLTIEGKTDVDLPTGLGGWDKEEIGEYLFIGNGIYQKIDDKYLEDGYKTKVRGFGESSTVNLKDVMRHKRGYKELEIRTKPSPYQMGEALSHVHILTKEDINVFEARKKIIDLNFPYQRKYFNVGSCDELLEGVIVGKRWTVEELEKDA